MPQLDRIPRGLGATPAQLGRGSSPRYRIFTRDTSYKRMSEITAFNKLTIVQRFNGIGTWELDTSSRARDAILLGPRDGIIVTRELDGLVETIFSGSIATEYTYTTQSFRVAGLSDDALLQNPARPTPLQATGPFPDEYYIRQGIASTLMLNFVSENIGPYAPSPWKLPALIMGVDPLAIVSNPLPTLRARLEPLLVVLQNFAESVYTGGLGFKLIQSDRLSNSLEFIVYVPQDRRADAKFSLGLQSIRDYQDTYSEPQANYFYVMLGDGLGNTRTILEGGDPTSIALYGRIIAQVIDARSVTNIDEGQQKLAEAIANLVASRKIAVSPFDIPNLLYGVDYDLGDLVTLVTQSGEYSDYIREVQLDFVPGSAVLITPKVGRGTDDTEEERTVSYINALDARVSNMERNYNIPDNSVTPEMIIDYARVNVGDLRASARQTPPQRWVFCRGQELSRTTYSALFSAIGVTYGSGNGTTTFNVPNMVGRIPVSSGTSFGLGASGGSATVNIQHAHTHSHGGGNLIYNHVHLGQAHTHPGGHSHGVGSIAIAHDHSVNIDHDHGSQASGHANFDSDVFGRDGGSATGTGHRHNTDLPSLGTTNVTSGGASNISKSGSTDSDTNQGDYAATYSGSPSSQSSTSWTGGSDPDSTLAGSTNLNVQNPYVVINWMIYAGV